MVSKRVLCTHKACGNNFDDALVKVYVPKAANATTSLCIPCCSATRGSKLLKHARNTDGSTDIQGSCGSEYIVLPNACLPVWAVRTPADSGAQHSQQHSCTCRMTRICNQKTCSFVQELRWPDHASLEMKATHQKVRTLKIATRHVKGEHQCALCILVL